MSNSETALETFGKNFNCAQAVLSTDSQKLGMSDKDAKKISCGFGAGCAKQSLLCGAVSGAFMVIGLKYGKSKEGEDNLKNLTYENVNKFTDVSKLSSVV